MDTFVLSSRRDNLLITKYIPDTYLWAKFVPGKIGNFSAACLLFLGFFFRLHQHCLAHSAPRQLISVAIIHSVKPTVSSFFNPKTTKQKVSDFERTRKGILITPFVNTLPSSKFFFLKGSQRFYARKKDGRICLSKCCYAGTFMAAR